MGLVTVAAACTNFFTPGAVSFLSTCYAYPPKLTAEQDWYQASVSFPAGSTAGSGAVIYVYIEPRRQKRIVPGPRTNLTSGPYQGKKWAQQTVNLLCYFRSSKDKSEDGGLDHATFLDSIETLLLSDRNLGTAPGSSGYAGGSPVIFQAGEGGDAGGDDIEIHPGMPVLITGSVTQWFSIVKFEAVEILNT